MKQEVKDIVRMLMAGEDYLTEEDEKALKENKENMAEYHKPETKHLYGSCRISIKVNNHGEYLKWKQYNGADGRKWEFFHTFPALMFAIYNFDTAMDVEMIAKKIVQLLEMGFDVHTADWQLAEQKSQLKQPI